HSERPPKNGDHQPGTNHRRSVERQSLRGSGQGHRQKNRSRGQYPGQQAGRKNQQARNRDRKGSQGNGSRTRYVAGTLVLGVLPTESLAFHATNHDGASVAWKGFYHLGFAPFVQRN